MIDEKLVLYTKLAEKGKPISAGRFEDDDLRKTINLLRLGASTVLFLIKKEEAITSEKLLEMSKAYLDECESEELFVHIADVNEAEQKLQIEFKADTSK